MSKKDNKSQSVQNWMRSNRIYEEFLFFYLLIIIFWVFVGLFTFGYGIKGYSQQQNLVFNFIYFLFLAGCLTLTPFWYKLMFGRRAKLQRRSAEIEAQVQNIVDSEERQAIQTYLAHDGRLPPRPLQRFAMIFIGWCILFELFFISSCVKDLTLVWQPEWVTAIIDWVASHTNTPPLNMDRDIFALSLEHSPFEDQYTDEHAFMESSLGHVALLFQFWRTIIFLPVLSALIVILWQPIDWLGMTRMDPRHIHSVGKFLWCSFLSIFLFLLLVGIPMMMAHSIIISTRFLTLDLWFNNFYLNALYLFFIFSLKFFLGWFYFWKRIFLIYIKGVDND